MKQAKFICDSRLSHRFLGLKRIADCGLGELFLNPLHGSSDVGDFPIAQMVKNLPAVQETWVQSLGSIPGSGRSPGGGNGNLLQYSCLENSMNRRDWSATVHGISKSQMRLSTHTQYRWDCFQELHTSVTLLKCNSIAVLKFNNNCKSILRITYLV